ncbi:PA2778 family cysteine peptidase [Pseudohongiella acticola]|jgi:tetratricopeptide (TPR) repeat protein|uniref:PA2778 family cysteine peptidase n=1 Tax=Pseudohongiella acticola TaxID=1524254 RepID=UPI0030EB2448
MKQLLLSLFSIIVLASCVTPPQSAALLRERPAQFNDAVLVPDVPFHPQEDYQCGPAALATVLGASQLQVNPEELVPLVYVPERQGSFQVEMIAAARSYGRLAYQLPPTLQAMFSEVRRGHPVLVMQNLGLDWYPQWHFAVVKGFDLQQGLVVLNSALTENYQVSLATFERTWARADHWAVLVVEPGIVPLAAEPDRYFNAVVALEGNNPVELVSPAYQSGLTRWPDNNNLLMGYGNLLYGQGDTDGAAIHYQRTINAHPDYAPAYNNLAQIRLQQQDLEQAMTLAEKAIELGGDFSDNYQRTRQRIQAAIDSQ